MKKIYLLLCVFFYLQMAAHAQHGAYYPGYIIKSDGDTVNGLVKKQPGNKQLQWCWFDRGDHPKQYFPDQIRGYAYTGGRAFISGVRPGYFVEVLIIGKLNLYKFKADYWVEKSDEIYPLRAHMDSVVYNGRNYVRQNLRWQGILSILISDCQQDMPEIQGAYFSEKSLTDIVKSYNECSGSAYLEIKNRIPWTVLKPGVMAGLNLSRLNTYFDEDLKGYFDNQYFSIDPDAGLLLRISFPRISERLTLQAEVHYNSSTYYSYREVNDATSYQYAEVITHLQTLTLPVSIRHAFPIKKSTANIELGFSVNRNLTNQSDLIIEKQHAYTNIVETTISPGIEITKWQPGLWAGVGMEQDSEKFSYGISLRYYMRLNDFDMLKGFEVNPDIISLSLIMIKK